VSRARKNTVLAYAFLTPALILFFTFIVYPFIYGFYISLNKWNGFGPMKFVGFNNYASVLKDGLFYTSLLHNVIYALISVVGKVGLALLLALLLNHSLKGISVFRGIFFTPVVISFVAVGILWQRIYDPNIGLLDGLLQTLGLMHTPIDWLGNPNLSLFSIILVDIWKWTGYHTVIYLAGLQIISRDFYESADIDGATAWQKLRYITLPQLRQMTIINITIACMGAFSVFDLVYIMTNGGPYQSTSVLLTYMYNITFASSNSNFGYGTTVAYLLFVIILAISIVQIKNMNAKDY